MFRKEREREGRWQNVEDRMKKKKRDRKADRSLNCAICPSFSSLSSLLKKGKFERERIRLKEKVKEREGWFSLLFKVWEFSSWNERREKRSFAPHTTQKMWCVLKMNGKSWAAAAASAPLTQPLSSPPSLFTASSSSLSSPLTLSLTFFGNWLTGPRSGDGGSGGGKECVAWFLGSRTRRGRDGYYTDKERGRDKVVILLSSKCSLPSSLLRVQSSCSCCCINFCSSEPGFSKRGIERERMEGATSLVLSFILFLSLTTKKAKKKGGKEGRKEYKESGNWCDV